MTVYEVKENSSIEVKRFYLPISIDKKCPSCGNNCTKDLSDDYLSYPKVNETDELYFYCDNCDAEFKSNFKMKISLEVEDNVEII